MPEHLVFALTVLATACVTLGGSWLVSRSNARTADLSMLYRRRRPARPDGALR